MRDLATSPIAVDLESAGAPDGVQYLEPVVPDGRLTNPEKIAADIKAKELARLDRMSLDWNVGRIVVLGWWTAEDGIVVQTCKTDDEERSAIALFWRAALHRTIVGYNVKGFDLRFLVQRSRLLRVPHPVLDFSPYSRRGVIDLFLDLTFNDGHRDTGAMRRTLQMFCRRFGILNSDTVAGKDVPQLIAEGNWDAVVAHCAADVWCTVKLAQRLDIITAPVIPEEVSA